MSGHQKAVFFYGHFGEHYKLTDDQERPAIAAVDAAVISDEVVIVAVSLFVGPFLSLSAELSKVMDEYLGNFGEE